METLAGGVSKQQPYSPHLKKVLKTYQLTAVKSLQGPSNVLDKGVIVKQEQENVDGDFTSPQLPPIQQLPILTTQDQSRSERSETLLESERISCFIVGGERRLCLPQVLNGVLHDFSLPQINQVCDELHIFCSRCNPEQLDVLKGNGILPMTAPSCGLITKTDAERLCSSLLHHAPAAKAAGKLDRAGMFSFKVYHECFGKCKGLCIPELYTEVDAVCIECLECHGMFSPRRFVCHVHHSPENRTCHWGFDSDNWRYYLQLVRDQHEEEHLMKLLDQIKDQHDEGAIVQAPTQHLKRKQLSADLPAMDRFKAEADADLHYMMKKAKMDIGPMDPFSYPAYHLYHPDPHNLLWYPWRAFRPSWSSSSKVKQLEPEPTVTLNLPGNLSHSPPVLLFPDRVVPMSQSERFERTFQPNVALAPRQPKQEVKTEALTEPTTMKRPATPPPPPSATLNPEIELSSDTDTDSSVDTLAAVAGQDTAGSCVDIVQQVVSLMSDISDVRVEAMRSRVVELVERLSRQLDSVEEDRRSLQRKNARLREREIEAQKIVEQLRDQLHQQQVKYSEMGEEAVSIKEEPE